MTIFNIIYSLLMILDKVIQDKAYDKSGKSYSKPYDRAVTLLLGRSLYLLTER
jgi:hypothetical protein